MRLGVAQHRAMGQQPTSTYKRGNIRLIGSRITPSLTTMLTIYCHNDNLTPCILTRETCCPDCRRHLRACWQLPRARRGNRQNSWSDPGALAGHECGLNRSTDGPADRATPDVTRQNVQRLADLLVKENLANFEVNPDHKGSPYLVLNGRGQAALAKLTKAANQSHIQLARKLTDTDVGALHRGLRRLIQARNNRDNPK